MEIDILEERDNLKKEVRKLNSEAAKIYLDYKSCVLNIARVSLLWRSCHIDTEELDSFIIGIVKLIDKKNRIKVETQQKKARIAEIEMGFREELLKQAIKKDVIGKFDKVKGEVEIEEFYNEFPKSISDYELSRGER